MTLPLPSPTAVWPPDELEAQPRCPMCAGTARQLLHTGLTDRLFRCAPGTWTVVQCQACRTAYLDPRPDAQSIAKAYTSYFTHDAAGSAQPASGLRHWLRREVNGWRNRQWHTDLQPASRRGGWWVSLAWPLPSLVRHQMRNLPHTPPRSGARLLDVGCGSGAFLVLARAAGWSVQGLDFDPVAVQGARRQGLEVHHGGLEQVANQQDSYDWITCSHVIEHVHEPVQWLRGMYALLRPGGTLWLQTPNIDSWGYREFGADWRALDPPRHLSIAPVDGLCDTLRKVGFDPRPQGLSPVLALAEFNASRALQQGGNGMAPFRWTQWPGLRYLMAALVQSARPGHAEFITIVAQKPHA